MTQPFVAQTSIGDTLDRGFAGMIADSGVDNHVARGKTASRKVASVAVTAVNTTHYIVTVTQNGVAHAAYDYTSDGSATTAEIVLGLIALINAGGQFVVASGTDTPLVLTATGDGLNGDFSVTYNGNMVETVLQVANQSIPYGKYVCKDDSSDENVVRLPYLSADVTGTRAKGIVCANNYTRVSAGVVRANSMASCLTKGRVLVTVEEAVKDGDPVYVRYAAGGSGLGSFRKSTGTSEAALLPAARYRSDAGILGLAVVEVNSP